MKIFKVPIARALSKKQWMLTVQKCQFVAFG